MEEKLNVKNGRVSPGSVKRLCPKYSEKRAADYLRLSLTDRCNLNCIYCVPGKKQAFFPREDQLSNEEIVRLVKLFGAIGVRSLRITGGEPLLRKDILPLINMLKNVENIQDISMTTNGLLLEKYADSLKDAGLDRLTISIDSLKRESFRKITGADCFESVFSGFEKAARLGFRQCKLNIVVMKDINEDEIPDFIRLSSDYPVIVRFIEFFPINMRISGLSRMLVTTREIKKMISESFGKLNMVDDIEGGGPAEYFNIQGTDTVIGFISNHSENFCSDCTRLRIDSTGRIFPCLYSSHTHDIRNLMRNRENDEVLLYNLREVMKIKHRFNKYTHCSTGIVEMSSIGG